MTLGSELRAFEASVLRSSRCVDGERLRRWLEADGARAGLAPPRGPVGAFPAHGEPKRPLAHQSEVLAALEANMPAALVGMPTGAGKTFTAVRHVLAALEAPAIRRVLWLAPQTLLLEQAEAEVHAAWWTSARGYDLTVTQRESAPDRVTERLLAMVTYQWMLRHHAEQEKYDLVVADEAHYLEDNQFGGLLKTLRAQGATAIGLSATPGRRASSELKHLVELFDGVLLVPRTLGTHPVEELRKRGVYASIEEVHLSTGRARGERGPLACAHDPRRLDAVVGFVTSRPTTDRVLLFCHSLAHCHVVAAALWSAGMSVRVVGSHATDSANRAAVEAFRHGQVTCLINVRYLAVGADFPFANVAVLSVPLGSPIMFEQVVGRVARGPSVGGSERSVVADFDGHLASHGGVKSYARFWEGWWVAG